MRSPGDPTRSGLERGAPSEDPAVALLQQLGYTYMPPELLDAERASFTHVVLVKRLSAVIKKLNPWISADNLTKAVRAITNVPAVSLIEANEKLYTTLTYGIALYNRGPKQFVRWLTFSDGILITIGASSDGY